MTDQSWSGGCQCGAVRFRVTQHGRSSLCHCRMCQKAFAGIGGLLVLAETFEWTRGAPKYFVSSDIARRGFCGDCGTPLSYETRDGVDLAIVAFDDPDSVAPAVQLASERRITWADSLPSLPPLDADEQATAEARNAKIVSYQHPDHDTTEWNGST